MEYELRRVLSYQNRRLFRLFWPHGDGNSARIALGLGLQIAH
jgi:hypothetical protein